MNGPDEFENSESVLELFKQILSIKVTKHTTCVRFDKIRERIFILKVMDIIYECQTHKKLPCKW